MLVYTYQVNSAVAGIVADVTRNRDVKVGNWRTTEVTCFSVQFDEGSGYGKVAMPYRSFY